MTSWKNTFLISRGLYGKGESFPPGDFLYYTCQNIDGMSKLVSSRRLNLTEIKNIKRVIEAWINNNSLLSHSDMQTFSLKSLIYPGGIIIIQVSFDGLTRLQKDNLLINFWNTTRSNMENLSKYEILYFQAYPINDVSPLYWNLQSFQKENHTISYLSSSLSFDDTNMDEIWTPVTLECKVKLRTEALKKNPTFVIHDNRTYYFDSIDGNIVCYFYSDKNPRCLFRKPYSIHKIYLAPQYPGKKYIWLHHLPECDTHTH